MIVFITTRGNGYTLKCLVDGTLGVPSPKFRITHYERLFGAWRVPRATYVFGDLERLAPWELRLAADLYRSMTSAGLRCLNDPAKVMARVEMLTALHAAGINPFAVLRADAAPRPRRFPVFIRSEDNHAKADATLYRTQQELELALHDLRESGIPLRGMLIVEQAAEPYSDRLWAKWGTWRIGDRTIVEHIAVDDTWLVKIGDHDKVTEAFAADERDAVASNRFAADVRVAFDIAAIEFGRADHGTVAGRPVIYEINTNPFLSVFSPGKRPLRQEAQLLARGRIATALADINTNENGFVSLPGTAIRRPIRWWRPGFVTPRRP
jgi:hypothetical protein